MHPYQFLELANTLSGGTKPRNAEYYRTAISRAYYAAFHIGFQTIEAIGIGIKKDAAAHNNVPSLLSACADHGVRTAGINLRKLYGRSAKLTTNSTIRKLRSRRKQS